MTATTNRSKSSVGVRSTAYNVLIGLTTLAILLQAVWAGIFLSYDDRPDSWINVHARGAEVAIGLCLLALIAAFVQLRRRRDLLIGTPRCWSCSSSRRISAGGSPTTATTW